MWENLLRQREQQAQNLRAWQILRTEKLGRGVVREVSKRAQRCEGELQS